MSGVGGDSSSHTQWLLQEKHSGPFEGDGGEHDEEIMMPPLGAHNDTSTTQKDRAWAVAFKVNVAFACLCALYYGRTGLEVMANNKGAWAGGGHRRGSDGPSLLVPLAAAAGIMGVAWGFAWAVLRMLIRASEQILQVRAQSRP